MLKEMLKDVRKGAEIPVNGDSGTEENQEAEALLGQNYRESELHQKSNTMKERDTT